MTRRLGDADAEAVLASASPLLEDRAQRVVASRALRGVDPSGAPVEATLGPRTLLVFVKLDCDGCHELAGLVRDGLEGCDVLGAMRVPGGGLPDARVDELTGARGRWLLGEEPFEALDVRSAPFFCVLDGDRRVVVEGIAFSRADVAALAGAAR